MKCDWEPTNRQCTGSGPASQTLSYCACLHCHSVDVCCCLRCAVKSVLVEALLCAAFVRGQLGKSIQTASYAVVRWCMLACMCTFTCVRFCVEMCATCGCEQQLKHATFSSRLLPNLRHWTVKWTWVSLRKTLLKCTWINEWTDGVSLWVTNEESQFLSPGIHRKEINVAQGNEMRLFNVLLKQHLTF